MPDTRATRELQIVDAVLTTIARSYRPRGRIYDELLASQPVGVLSGLYPVFDETYWFSNDVDNKLSDRAETPEVDFKWSTNPYLCEDYGLKVSITPRERQQTSQASAGAALRLEISKVQFLVTQMANQREKRLAALLRKTTNGGQLTSGAAATAAFATSTAIEADWKTALTTVYNLTGYTPNVAVVPYAKAYDMATNATLRDIFKYVVNSENIISLGQGNDGEEILLPRVFHGTRIIVPKGSLAQTGHEGAAKSLSDVWGTSVRFLYVDKNAAWGTPSVAYAFEHPVLTGNGTAATSEEGFVVDRWHENDPVKDLIRATECVDERVTAPDMGYELTGT